MIVLATRLLISFLVFVLLWALLYFLSPYLVVQEIITTLNEFEWIKYIDPAVREGPITQYWKIVAAFILSCIQFFKWKSPAVALAERLFPPSLPFIKKIKQ